MIDSESLDREDSEMLKAYFEFEKHQTSTSKEVLAGVTTFLTMAYILVVQPKVLAVDFAGNETGMSPSAILLATCLSAGFASILMGVLARLPIALAPGMGTNYFFVGVVMGIGGMQLTGVAWQQALAIVFVSGILFLIISAVGARQLILNVMSPGLKSAIGVGIGLFIAMIGLKNAGVIHAAPSLVELNLKGLRSADAAVFWSGLFVTLVLMARKLPGSILIGLVVSGVVAASWGKISPTSIVGTPDADTTLLFQLDFSAVITFQGVSWILVFLFMDIFDTTGTLVGVSQQAGLIENGEVPRMNRAMLADSAGTIFGALVGTSTVTSYIESAAGVQQGGRTGLTAVVVGLLFLAAIFLSPLLLALSGYSPLTASALVVVGAMMFRSAAEIDWKDESESIPAFLVILGIPLFFSIGDGIALGLIASPIVKLASRKESDVSITGVVLAGLLIAYYVFVRAT